MQLYEVWFQLHFENYVDIGRAIVCAQDQTNAKEIVIASLDLPVAALAQCDVKRVKPNLFLLERKDINKPTVNVKSEKKHQDEPVSQKGLRFIANQLGENREYKRGMTEYVAQQKWAMEKHGRADEADFECRILATVSAESEDVALRRLGAALKERSETGRVDTSRKVKKIFVDLVPDYGGSRVKTSGA